jgi:DnaJ-class molecular chaperone
MAWCLLVEPKPVRALQKPNVDMTDHYAALGLGSDASLADVKKAFRQKASAYHPDRNAAPDAPARFRAVQAAFEVLSDADKRQAYDDNRKRNLLDSPIDTAQEIWRAYFSQVTRAATHTA